MSVEDEITLIKNGIKELQGSMKKMMAWVVAINELVEKYTGVDIDKLIEEEKG